MGNTLFAVLHEMGHVAIDEMKLPVLGREEVEADAFATLRLLRIGSDFSQRVLAESAKNWFLSARRDQETGAESVYYGEHNLSEQRAFQVVCLMVGSDPTKFKSLADKAQMPPERQPAGRITARYRAPGMRSSRPIAAPPTNRKPGSMSSTATPRRI